MWKIYFLHHCWAMATMTKIIMTIFFQYKFAREIFHRNISICRTYRRKARTFFLYNLNPSYRLELLKTWLVQLLLRFNNLKVPQLIDLRKNIQNVFLLRIHLARDTTVSFNIKPNIPAIIIGYNAIISWNLLTRFSMWLWMVLEYSHDCMYYYFIKHMYLLRSYR